MFLKRHVNKTYLILLSQFKNIAEDKAYYSNKHIILTADGKVDHLTGCISGDKAAQIGSAASEPSSEAGHCWTRVQRSAIPCHA